ncbi:C40 family peptidase [Actinophytocola sp.]|uniref:C40 family peptidase n=1 Tax=Actinophytocola sp. TaxID=1872138 RepID=UPI00389A9D1C
MATTHNRARALRLMLGAPLAFGLAVLMFLILAVVVDDDEAGADDGIQGVACAPSGTTATSVGNYGPEQMGNATIIVDVGTSRGIPDQGIVIALMAAMTESGLRNLDHGDRDSLGLFQMRPSQGWGTPAQVTDPVYAANKFYDVLLTVPNWQSLAPGAAAQAVERSAFPDRYNKHEQTARQILGAVRGVGCPANGGLPAGGGQQVDLPANPRAETVINAALSQLGVPYAWAGGTARGPSAGTGVDQGVVGFDCSGLVLYAYAQIGVAVPHQTQAIWTTFQPAIRDPTEVQPGDLILLSRNGQPGGIHHVGIFMGDGKVVHAPQSGDVVKVVEDIWKSTYWSGEFIGAVRPGV